MQSREEGKLLWLVAAFVSEVPEMDFLEKRQKKKLFFGKQEAKEISDAFDFICLFHFLFQVS